MGEGYKTMYFIPKHLYLLSSRGSRFARAESAYRPGPPQYQFSQARPGPCCVCPGALFRDEAHWSTWRRDICISSRGNIYGFVKGKLCAGSCAGTLSVAREKGGLVGLTYVRRITCEKCCLAVVTTDLSSQLFTPRPSTHIVSPKVHLTAVPELASKARERYKFL